MPQLRPGVEGRKEERKKERKKEKERKRKKERRKRKIFQAIYMCIGVQETCSGGFNLVTKGQRGILKVGSYFK